MSDFDRRLRSYKLIASETARVYGVDTSRGEVGQDVKYQVAQGGSIEQLYYVIERTFASCNSLLS